MFFCVFAYLTIPQKNHSLTSQRQLAGIGWGAGRDLLPFTFNRHQATPTLLQFPIQLIFPFEGNNSVISLRIVPTVAVCDWF